MMTKTRTHASLRLAVGATALLTACSVTQTPILTAGGSGVEGSGLDRTPSRAPFSSHSAAPTAEVRLVDLGGEALAPAPLKSGDPVDTNATFELRSGHARLRLPDGTLIDVTAPARLRFAPVEGQLAPLLETGQFESGAAGLVATPQIAVLKCNRAYRIARSNAATSFTCSSGALRWRLLDENSLLSGASHWVINETARRVAQR